MNHKVYIMLIAGLTIFSLFFILDLGTVKAQDASSNLVTSSPLVAKISDMRGASSEDVGFSNGTHFWTGGLESWIKASNGAFVPYILSQNSTQYMVDNAQAPFSINKNNCAVTIYDNSAPIASNPGVLISKEFWNVGFKLPSSPNWTFIDMSNVSCTISVTTNSSGIFFSTTKSFPVGSLNVAYAKRTNTGHLESFPVVINTNASSYYIKPIEQQTGINADSMSTDSTTFSTSKILSQSNMSKTNTLLINKGSKSFAIGVQGSFNNLNNMTVTKTASGFSLSEDFGNNITPLTTAQSFTVDPTYGYTAASFVSSQYGTSIASTACNWSGGTNYGLYIIDLPTSSSNSACFDLTSEWDTSTIPSNSVVTSTSVKYDITTQYGSGSPSCNWYPLTSKPSTSTVAQRLVDSQDGIAYVTDSGCATLGNGKTIVLGSSANSDLQNHLAAGWFGVGNFYATQNRGSTEYYAKYANMQLQVQYNNSTNDLNIGGNIVSTKTSGTFKITAQPGVAICIGTGC